MSKSSQVLDAGRDTSERTGNRNPPALWVTSRKDWCDASGQAVVRAVCALNVSLGSKDALGNIARLDRGIA